MWLVTIVGGFIFFTDTHVRTWRIVGGACHALLHLAAAFAVGWLALRLTRDALGLSYGSTLQLLLSGVVTFTLGGPVGSFLLGVYLFVSIRLFGRHGNEAFSSLRVQDYKEWLRLRIGADGALTVYAIAIDRVPRRWRDSIRGGEPTSIADDAHASAPRIIDKVVVRP